MFNYFFLFLCLGVRSPGLRFRRIVLVLSVGDVELRQLIVAMVGREQMDCVSGSDGGTVDDKVGKMMRETLGKAHFSLGGGRKEAR